MSAVATTLDSSLQSPEFWKYERAKIYQQFLKSYKTSCYEYQEHNAALYFFHYNRWWCQIATHGTGLKRAHFPILINGKGHWAFLDNHASNNIMSLNLALKLGLAVREDSVAFKMIDGSYERSLGYTWVDCTLPADASTSVRLKFNVFATAVRPLIMGGPFLHETQLLTAAKNLQLKGSSLAHGTPHQYSLYLIKIETKDFLRSATGIAISDSGADSVLISLSFAQKNALPILPRQDRNFIVRAANGKPVKVKGTIDASIGPVNPKGNLNSTRQYRFLVVKGLPFDIVLGAKLVKAQTLSDLCIPPFSHRLAESDHNTCYVENLGRFELWIANHHSLKKKMNETLPGEKYIEKAEKNLKDLKKHRKTRHDFKEKDPDKAQEAQRKASKAWVDLQMNRKDATEAGYDKFVDEIKEEPWFKKLEYERLQEEYRASTEVVVQRPVVQDGEANENANSEANGEAIAGGQHHPPARYGWGHGWGISRVHKKRA